MENKTPFTVETALSSMNTSVSVITGTMSSVRQGLTTSLIILQSPATSLIILQNPATSLNHMNSLPSRSLSLPVSLILMKKSNLSPILDLFDDCCLFVSI